jgi:hypothetical protein
VFYFASTAQNFKTPTNNDIMALKINAAPHHVQYQNMTNAAVTWLTNASVQKGFADMFKGFSAYKIGLLKGNVISSCEKTSGDTGKLSSSYRTRTVYTKGLECMEDSKFVYEDTYMHIALFILGKAKVDLTYTDILLNIKLVCGKTAVLDGRKYCVDSARMAASLALFLHR